jgi:K+-sensing histidine kinase KdpD
VTALRTNAEVLLDGDDLPPAQRRALLADVVEQAEELTSLVGDVIGLGRDEQRDVAVEDVRLDVLVAEAVERARRHLPPGGVVEVTVREGEVVVRDHGPGVPADDLGQIFDRFHRGSKLARAVGVGARAAHRAAGRGAARRLRLGLAARRRWPRRAALASGAKALPAAAAREAAEEPPPVPAPRGAG